jgi:hypothetical protein
MAPLRVLCKPFTAAVQAIHNVCAFTRALFQASIPFKSFHTLFIGKHGRNYRHFQDFINVL